MFETFRLRFRCMAAWAGGILERLGQSVSMASLPSECSHLI
jgi:hypothetical protein